MLTERNPFVEESKEKYSQAGPAALKTMFFPSFVIGRLFFLSLHVLELIDAPFRVALADLPQRLVLVAALLDVLLVQLIHGRLFRLVLRSRQIFLQHLHKFNKIYTNT